MTYTFQDSLAAVVRIQTRGSREVAVSVSHGYMIGMGSREDWRIISKENKYWYLLGEFYIKGSRDMGGS